MNEEIIRKIIKDELNKMLTDIVEDIHNNTTKITYANVVIEQVSVQDILVALKNVQRKYDNDEM